jgi:hypothetical protein
MIDRKVRDGLALALRRFAVGHLTRPELDQIVTAAEDSPDAGVVAMCDEIYWTFLNLGPKRLVGKHRLDRLSRRNVARWVLFLRSEVSYEWKVRRGWDLLKASSRGETPYVGGDVSVWPFISPNQVERVSALPAFASRVRAV